MPADEEERAAAGPSGASAPAAADEQPGPSSAAPSPAQPTRPSIKRRRNLRQTRVNAVGDDDAIDVKGASAAPSIDHAALLEDTRALQRMRSKRTGIDAATLLLGSSRDRVKAFLAASGAASDAEALAAASRLSATEAALGNTFGAAGGGGGGASNAVRAREEAEAAADAEATRYVESRLAAALGRAPRSNRMDGDDDEEGGEGGKEKTTGNKTSDLFEPPREARLSLLSASNADAADPSALEPRGAGLGGDDDARGAVGLVEVALTADDRLRNIERSEAAKQKARAAAAAAAAAAAGISSSFSPPSSNSNRFGGNGDGFRRGDLPASFGGGKRR